MGLVINNNSEREQARPKTKWRRRSVFYDKLTYVYLEMPKFNKTENESVSMYDKWLFVLKNLTRLMERPAALQERMFQRVFDLAEIARFTPDESRIY